MHPISELPPALLLSVVGGQLCRRETVAVVLGELTEQDGSQTNWLVFTGEGIDA